MAATSAKVSMTDSQLEQLSKIIYERSGIHFENEKKYVLESRLGRRLAELEMDNFDQYIQFISFGPYRDDEFQEMFNRITINETSFFRNEPQLNVFESHVLPQLIEARSANKRLRLWSAACSTGEEAYTLAIMLQRTLGVRLPDWHIEILGTDISEKALEVAESGQYSSYAIRSTPSLVLKRYFKEEGTHFVLDPEVRQMVSFEKHNLKDRMGAKRHGKWDVIFCRNVLIYFDAEMKQGVAQMFGDQLQNDGWLFIGHSESLRGLDTLFEPVSIPQGFCYQKVGIGPVSTTS